ncbi:MAG: hypothetical protein Q8R13_06300 [bacterium]|nr:hypothetical protein [bacterium]
MADSRLGELQKKLYTPKEDFSERKADFKDILGTTPPAEPPSLPPATAPAREPAPVQLPATSHSMRTLLLWGAAGLFVLGVAGGIYATFFRGPVFARRDVLVNLEIAQEVRGGEEVEFIATVKNNTTLALNDVRLTLVFPEGTIRNSERTLTETLPLPAIPEGKEHKETLKVRILGTKDALKNFSARLSYRPGSISSRFENVAETSTTIVSTPFAFSIAAPKEAFPGSAAEYILTYENASGIDFEDTALTVEYPREFIFTEAAPAPTSEARWNLGTLKGNQKGTITLKGAFNETSLEQEFRASLGILVDMEFVPYAEVGAITKIVKPYLTLEPTVNGQQDYPARAGERLVYHANWRNIGPVALQDIVITARLSGVAFDRTSLEPQKGIYDSRTDEITWTSREVPELALALPNSSGTLDFEVTLVRDLQPARPGDRELTVSAAWSIETKSVPKDLHLTSIRQESTLISRISSRLELDAQGYYGEPSAAIANSGPIPPRVNETTTYTIHWKIKNSTNPVENARIRAFLGPGVTFTGKTLLTGSHNDTIRYDSRSGEVSWEIPRIDAGVGTVTESWEAVFQVSITPSIIQRDTVPTLVAASLFEGTDAFTEAKLEARAGEITASLLNDPRVGPQGGKVE